MTTEKKENPVWRMLADLASKKGITEIVINNPKKVFVEKDGQFFGIEIQFNKESLHGFIQEVASYNKKVINAENPMLDGILPDGSRINIVIEPFAYGSPAITIRKYLRHIKSFDTSPGLFGLSEDWVTLLRAMVRARLNIIVAGGTGAGKTTFLNLLLQEIPHGERLVCIEDTLELQVDHPNHVRLEVRGKNSQGIKNLVMADFVKNSLRMRPDRIVIGEIRGGELFDLMQAMNTGHDGSMSTLHANSPGELFSRMENLFLMSGLEMPVAVIRQQVATALHYVVQIQRDHQGQRIVTHITELTGMEGTNISRQHLGIYEKGSFHATGVTPMRLKKLHEVAGLPLDFFNTIK